MKQLFTSLFQQTNSAIAIENYWLELETHYNEPGRFYHTLEHIAAVIQNLEMVPAFDDANAIWLAAFYHDAIYDPTAKDNEEQSAELARIRLTEAGFHENTIARCVQHILATKRHEASDSADTNLFIDADLATLGSDPETYRQYAADIRKEYAMYPDELYNPGRAAVLKHLLGNGIIYKTDLFRDRCEQQAHINLEWELNTLTP